MPLSSNHQATMNTDQCILNKVAWVNNGLFAILFFFKYTSKTSIKAHIGLQQSPKNADSFADITIFLQDIFHMNYCMCSYSAGLDTAMGQLKGPCVVASGVEAGEGLTLMHDCILCLC